MRTVSSVLLLVSVAAAAAACSSNGTTSAASGADSGGASSSGGDGSSSSSSSGGDGGSSGGGGDASDAAPSPSNYADPSMWLCGGGASPDHCLDALTATAIAPDLSQSAVSLAPAASPPVDCFYVYPTVDVTDPAGNVKDFSNEPYIVDIVHAQAAPFRTVCRLYAPLYHQMTFAGYSSANASQYLEVAYADIAAAFHQYMTAWNAGRDFVLIGHSQGTHMLRRLVQREIEGHADVQAHLLLGILNGALGDITVPAGQVVGGSFQSTPLCTKAAQRGCVFTVNTFAAGYPPTSTYGAGFAIPAGDDVACASPAAPGGGLAPLSASYFYAHYTNPSEDPPQNLTVSSDFEVLPGFYTGQCKPNAQGLSYFEVAAAPAAGDQRTNPIPFDNVYYTPSILGLHLIDFSFPTQDMLAAVSAVTGAPAADAGSGAD